MLITQFCTPNCEHNNTTVYQGSMFPMNVLAGQLMIGSKRFDERCSECGEPCILIVENEERPRLKGAEAEDRAEAQT